jgi:hypothetical protein
MDAINIVFLCSRCDTLKQEGREDEVHDCDPYDLPANVAAIVREYRQADSIGLGALGCS